MRCPRSWVGVAVSILVSAAALGAEADDCERLRSLPGNDDIVVMVDTSLSTIPIIDEIRSQLAAFVECYVKQGDFVVIASFDATSQLEIAGRILDRERDLPILVEQIGSLTPRREICWRRENGALEESRCDQATRRQGGGWKTDLGAMMEQLQHVLAEMHTPENRRFVAIYTDGRHDPPDWSPHQSVPSLPEIFEKTGFRDILLGGTHLGLIATSSEAAGILEQVAETMDPDRALRNRRRLAVQPDAGEGMTESVRRLIDSHVFLYPDEDVEVRRLELGKLWRRELEREFVLHNRTPSQQKVVVEKIRAVLTGPDGKVDEVAAAGPFEWTVDGGEQLRARVRIDLPGEARGDYSGRLLFEVSSGTSLSPPFVEVEYESVGFWDAHPGLRLAAWIVSLLLVLALGAWLLRWYLRAIAPRPIYVDCTYRSPRDETASGESSQVPISCGESLAVGGMNSGAPLAVREVPVNQVLLDITRRRFRRYRAVSALSGREVKLRIGVSIVLTNKIGQGWEIAEGEPGPASSDAGETIAVTLHEGMALEAHDVPEFRLPSEYRPEASG